jgi:hypothetical protein
VQPKRLIVGLTLPNGINRDATPAWKSIVALQAHGVPGWEIVARVVVGAGIGRNRNKIVCNAKSTAKMQARDVFDYDAVLFVDFDISFTPMHVERLLNSGRQIISGAYRYKDNAAIIHAGEWGLRPGLIGKNLDARDAGTVRIDRCGGGFLLIAADVFTLLPYPWFRHTIVEVEIGGVLNAEETSEDFGFCLLVGQAGLPIYCDTGCMVDHQKTRLIDPQTAQDGIEMLKRVTLTGGEVEKWCRVHNALTAGAADAC